MIHCPRCQSPNVISNRFDEAHIERATQAAQAAQSIGIRRLSIVAALVAMIFKGVNGLLLEFRCLDCGNKFDG